MREIKFRVWCIEGQCWMDLYDPTKYPGTAFDGESLDSLGLNIYNLHDYHAEKHKEFILVEYTGLKDKNGKEIYEGDILKFKDWLPKEVIWQLEEKENACATYVLKNTLAFLATYDSPYYEIIGNKFENPELLRGDV